MTKLSALKNASTFQGLYVENAVTTITLISKVEENMPCPTYIIFLYLLGMF